MARGAIRCQDANRVGFGGIGHQAHRTRADRGQHGRQLASPSSRRFEEIGSSQLGVQWDPRPEL
jgi:hypothetical protein